MNKNILNTLINNYENYYKEYRYWYDSLLRPWRKIYLYEHLYRIYSICLDKTYNKEIKKTDYEFSSNIGKALEHIKLIRNNAYKDFEKCQWKIDNFGYDRDINRERIMYKKIFEECDSLLKLIK